MSSGFITESEILEQRRRRQEEWEKVRTEDQPKEVPEESYDTRPLFHRLEEQRLRKEAEYEEAHKLKNMIRVLDDDEVGFLDLVEETKAKAAQQISLEEKKEMQEFRERVSSLAESQEMTRLKAQLLNTVPPRSGQSAGSSQKNKLEGVVVRKRKASDTEEKSPAKKNGVIEQKKLDGAADSEMKCIGVLPGLGHYNTDSSSDSNTSSDSEAECCTGGMDLLGRVSEHSHAAKKSGGGS